MVLITGCSLSNAAGASTFASITVPSGSQLIFDDASINITVGGILVSGALRIGSDTCRVSSPISITFKPTPGVDLSFKVRAQARAR